jgi:hypothetical protein
MKSLTHILSITATMLTCSIVFADEHKDVDPFSVGAPAIEEPPGPNHLEPIPAYDPDGYDQAIFKSLLGKEPGEIWMIGRPSFSTEYAVTIRHEITYAPAHKSEDAFVDRVIESEKWVVEYAEAKKKIWRWKDLGGGKMELDIKATKDVSRFRAEITHEFVLALIDAWRSVLLQTHYPREDNDGLDGVTFQFYCNPNLFGQTWSPSGGVPLLITNLGHKLGEVAKADIKSRGPLISECIAMAKKIASPIKPEQSAEGKPPAAAQPPHELNPNTRLP